MDEVRPAPSAEVGHEPAPLAVDAKTLARMLKVSLRKIREMDATGKLPRPLRLGGCVRWWVEEIQAWLAAGVPDRRTWQALRREQR